MNGLQRGWRLIRAKHLYRVVDERARNSTLPLLAVSIHHGVVPRDSLTEDEPRADDLGNYKRCARGDVVLNRMRAFQGGVGAAPQAGIVSPDYLVLRLVNDVNVRYFHHLFRSAWFVSEMTARLRGIGSSDQGNVRTPRINAEELGDIVIALPDLDEQREIADFLDAETARIDALIAKKQTMIELFEERRVATTDAAIWDAQGPARPVASLAAYVNGWPFKPEDFTPDGLPVVRIAQLVDPEAPTDLFDGELPERVRLREGDLVFSWSASLQVRVWERGPAYLNQHLFRVLPATGVNKSWLRFALDAATRRFTSLMHGSAMTHITQPMMKVVRIPVPIEDRQREVADALDQRWRRVDRVTRGLRQQIGLLREHRKALITAAVTGELDLARAAP